jgi:hypothetical protein
MAELEGIKAEQKMYKAFTSLQSSTETTLQMAYQSIKVIESTGPCAEAGSNVAGMQ